MRPTKKLLIAINTFYMVFGLLIFGAGIYGIIGGAMPVSKMAFASAIIIVAGILVMVSSVLGCFIANRRHLRAILLYIILCTVVGVIAVVAGVLAFAFKSSLPADVSSGWFTLWNDPSLIYILSSLQQLWRCCGYTDPGNQSAPACPTYAIVNSIGCETTALEFYSSRLMLMAIAGIAFGALHALGVILGVRYRKQAIAKEAAAKEKIEADLKLKEEALQKVKEEERLKAEAERLQSGEGDEQQQRHSGSDEDRKHSDHKKSSSSDSSDSSGSDSDSKPSTKPLKSAGGQPKKLAAQLLPPGMITSSPDSPMKTAPTSPGTESLIIAATAALASNTPTITIATPPTAAVASELQPDDMKSVDPPSMIHMKMFLPSEESPKVHVNATGPKRSKLPAANLPALSAKKLAAVRGGATLKP
eukprot:TRINITY_DN6488_c0_g1_i1.p3 TRINITY_DN6488_c0_g1~~TRINITY_DN6488_c0_g1_i1.p3  ORF type:complete len:417 (-),score=74.43 TRINITY_DN6488_c0_g1_i1:1210-2460(-)